MLPGEKNCHENSKWLYFFGSSLCTFLFAIFIASINQAISHKTLPNIVQSKISHPKYEMGKVSVKHTSLATKMRIWCEQVVLKTDRKGKIMNIIALVFNLTSYIIYAIDGQQGNEICITWTESARHQIDFCLHIYFLFYFFVRVISSHNKVYALLTVKSVIDFFTIPPNFVTIYLNRTWIGFRFLRAACLLQIPGVYQNLSKTENFNSIRTIYLICIILSIWVLAAGCIYLLESAGDPFHFQNPNPDMSFYVSIYFTLVTITTVGYGDITCSTYLGRAFTLVFICIALIIYSKLIPELVNLIGNKNPYPKVLYEDNDRRHIVICGYITYETISNFLKDFFHENRNHDVEIIILDHKQPDMMLESLLKHHSATVKFYNGSSMNTKDLHRVRLGDAECCLIFADKYSLNPDSEDAANIMRVISIKNHAGNVRVIVQLLLSRNQIFLFSIPNWNYVRGDDIITLSELKLGFIAQSCLAPGFSTLMANLVAMRSFKNDFGIPKSTADYLGGSKMNIYSIKFSSAFFQMKFSDVAILCFFKLKILLIALEIVQKDDGLLNIILINPITTLIKSNTNGFFIAETYDDVKRARIYCSTCHKKVTDVKLIKICRCTLLNAATYINELGDLCLDYQPHGHRHHQNITFTPTELPRLGKKIQTTIKLRQTQWKKPAPRAGLLGTPAGTGGLLAEMQRKSHPHVSRHTLVAEARAGTRIPNTALGIKKNRRNDADETESDNNEKTKKDSRAKNNLPRQSKRLHREHEILEPEMQFDSTGMYHWCPTKKLEDCLLLDDDNKSQTELNNHIIICAIADANSLIGLRNLILPLRASNIQYTELKYIAVIGSIEYIQNEWEMLANFPKILFKNGSPLSRADLRAANINTCFMCCILTGKNPGTQITALSDKEAILASLNIKSMSFDTQKSSVLPDKSSHSLQSDVSSFYKLSGDEIPLITELINDTNVQYLHQDDDDNPETELYLTQPFACGNVFSVSCLDAVISTTYFNQSVFSLVRWLITGGATPELDIILAEGNLSFTVQNTEQSLKLRERSRISQISLSDPNYSSLLEYSFYGKYGELFKSALEGYGILCLGLYRFRDLSQEYNASSKRYVITNPPSDFTIMPSDKVYVLLQYKSIKTILPQHSSK